MVQEGVMLNGQTEIYILERGTVNTQNYCKVPHVCNFCGAIRNYFIFMDDNACYLHEAYVDNLLESKGIY